MTYTKQSLQEYIDRMMHEVLNVKAKFIIWSSIQTARQYRLKTLNFAPGFFNVVNQSMISEVIISLCKIFENDKKAPGSLRKLLGIVKGHAFLFNDGENEYVMNEKTIIDLKELVDKEKETVKNLFYWRNKVIAHNDKEYYFNRDNLFKDAKLSETDLEILIYKSGEILNEISLALSGKQICFNIDNAYHEELDRIFDVLYYYQDIVKKDNHLK